MPAKMRRYGARDRFSLHLDTPLPRIRLEHAQGDTSQGQDIMRQPKNRDHPRHVPEHALLYGALRHLEGDITAMAHPLLRADLDQLLLVRRRRMSSLGPGIRHPGYVKTPRA